MRHRSSTPEGTPETDDGVRISNARAEIPWGSTLLTCPGCGSPNNEAIEAEVCPWTHDDGRPAFDIGMLFRCLACDDTFRLIFLSRGLSRADGGSGECTLMEHWMSGGIWS